MSKQIHIEEIEVSPLSPKVGKTLKESNFRRNTGVHIVSIIRGNKKLIYRMRMNGCIIMIRLLLQVLIRRSND
ncbi:MAG: hypothetical protein LIP05_02770 [Tannerellaceae bacterium]|nr:hypothetical protein [Tannerellaceae bacterium]